MDLSHLVWPFFDVEHRHLAAEFERWAQASLGEFEQCEGGDGSDARRIFELLAASGWLDQTMPQAGKIDLRVLSLLREICGYSSAMADVALSGPWLGILPIALYGSSELKERLLPGYLTGRLIPAFALSEPDAGSDVAAITSTARFHGEHYVINGRKTWTSNAGLADLYVVFARMEGGAGSGGICAFAVDGDQTGIGLEQLLSVLPPHTVGTWTLDNCCVAKDRLIGEAGQRFKIAMHCLELFRPTVGRRSHPRLREAGDGRSDRTQPIADGLQETDSGASTHPGQARRHGGED